MVNDFYLCCFEMLCKWCALVSILLLHNVVDGGIGLDMEFPNSSNYWYNISGVIREGVTFDCSIRTNSKPTVIWMNKGNLLTDLWKEKKEAEVYFSFISWNECTCNEVMDSVNKPAQSVEYKPLDYFRLSTFNQATVSFKSGEILDSTCRLSQNNFETNVFWDYDIQEIQENIIPYINEADNDIFIIEMKIQAGSEFDSKINTCNISDVILTNDYLKTDEGLPQIATGISSNYLNNCSSSSDCNYNDIFLECTSHHYCDCVSGYAFDSSDSRCEYNYFLNITVAAIAFSVLLSVMFLIWCVTTIIRSYRRIHGRNNSPQNEGSLRDVDSNLQVITSDVSSSRSHQSSLDLPPAYLEVERSETPPPSFESIYSIELKVVKTDSETSTLDAQAEDIYAICGNGNSSITRDNSEIKIDT